MDGPIPKHQDRLQPMAHDVGVFTCPEDKCSSWPINQMDFHKPASTIAVPHRTRLGYWARDVAVVSLPQLLVWSQDHRTAADLMIEFEQSPIIVQRYRNKAPRSLYDELRRVGPGGAGKASAKGRQLRRRHPGTMASSSSHNIQPSPGAAGQAAGEDSDNERLKCRRWMRSLSNCSSS